MTCYISNIEVVVQQIGVSTSWVVGNRKKKTRFQFPLLFYSLWFDYDLSHSKSKPINHHHLRQLQNQKPHMGCIASKNAETKATRISRWRSTGIVALRDSKLKVLFLLFFNSNYLILEFFFLIDWFMDKVYWCRNVISTSIWLISFIWLILYCKFNSNDKRFWWWISPFCVFK